MASLQHNVLIIGKVWPEPESSAAGTRMMQLISTFQKHQWEITFASTAAKSGFEAHLEAMGITEQSIKLNNSSFDDFVANLNPDIVLFDRFTTEEQFGWRVAENCPQALRILDTEDLHCLREARYKSWKSDEHVDVRDLDISKREIASILRCDLSLIISSHEMKLLQELFRIDKSILFHLPFMLDGVNNNTISKWLSIDKRSHFISIGNFHHQPNWNAVLYLKEDIWPIIRQQLPEAELHIYGAYASQKVEQLHNEQEGFLIKGRATNAKEVVGESRVLLAPLRFGAGLKGKLIEAMQCGTPSVTTKIGAEAMHANLPWPGAIEDNAVAFAKAAVELYRNQEKWQESQQAAIQIINQLFDREKFENQLISKIEFLMGNLNSQRRNNFMGAILQHHTTAGTKYMSKWIEEKNRNRD